MMRFELYEGARRVGVVEWVRPGRVRIQVADARERYALALYFRTEVFRLAGLFEANGDALAVRRPDRSTAEFELACVELRHLRSYRVAPLPARERVAEQEAAP